MAGVSANGSTVSFGGTAITNVTSITFSENGNPIDVTDLTDSATSFIAGMPTFECTVEMLGTYASSVGTTGAVVVAWTSSTSAGSDGISAAIITKNETSGGINEPLKTSLTFQPAG